MYRIAIAGSSRVFSVVKSILIGLLVVSSEFTAKAAAPTALLAAPVTLAWEASPDSSVVGYAIYYGIVNASVTSRFDSGSSLRCTLASLYAGSNYFFLAVAYDGSGLESNPSDILLYTPPALSSLQVSELADGTMSLQFGAAAGTVSRIEYSPTLNPPQWQTLNSATADTNGNITINDPLSGRPNMRFYRGISP